MKTITPLILSLLSSSLLCHAQGFYWNTAGGRSLAMGGIYVPSSSGVLDALSANPAGLANVTGPETEVSLTGAAVRGSFSNAANSNSPIGSSFGAIPYGAFGMPIGKSRFSFGIGEIPELTSVADWHYRDAPGVAGASYGLVQEKSAIVAMRSVAGIGVYISPWLSLGAAFGADYNTNTLEAPYTFQSQPVVKGLKTMLDLHTDGFGYNTSLGAILRPSHKVQFALAWKSRTIIDSTGSATGSLDQQLNALGIAAAPAFKYSATVHNVLPQSIDLGASWRVSPRWTLAAEGGWINWKDAFHTLPVELRNGTNALVNTLLSSTSLDDGVPLDWKDQFSIRGGFERVLTESVTIRAGFSHANNPVPSSTLSPLTAAMLLNQISCGVSWKRGWVTYNAAYTFNPTTKASVARSALASGEYNNSAVSVGSQAFSLSVSIANPAKADNGRQQN